MTDLKEKTVKAPLLKSYIIDGRVEFPTLEQQRDADHIYYLALYKEAGKIYSQEEAQGLVDAAIKRARAGYVQLDENQSVDLSSLEMSGSNIPLHYRTFQLMVSQGWKKVKEAK